MEIHKPKPWQGWREFLKEYLIIVLGVLTALAGEQAVEWLNRNEQAEHAERIMRLELADDNGPQAYGRLLITHCLDDRIAMIRDGATAAPADQLRGWLALYAPPFRSWDSEAWKAVQASDAGKFMGPARLLDWSAAYRIVPGMSEMNAQESELAAELRSALPPSGEAGAADRQNVRRLAGLLRFANSRMTRGSELLLARTRSLDATVPVGTQKDLLSRARALFGACVVAPDLHAPPAARDLSTNLRGLAR
jgi:hypothetical protein